MLRQMFHVVIFVHHSYVSWCLTHSDCDIEHPYLYNMKHYYFRYLTVWNLVLQMVLFGSCIAEDILEASGKKLPSFIPLQEILKLKNYLFRAVIAPSALTVASVFWIMFLYDRDLVYPAIVDDAVPVHLNHGMHSVIVPAMILEMKLHPKHHEQLFSTTSEIIGTYIYSSLYVICLLWTYFVKKVWMYPIFYLLGWTQIFILLMFAAYGVSLISYLASSTISSFIQMKGAKKKVM